jgi:signal peptidase I
VFGFLKSEEKKMRDHAANWLEVAERVFNFRRDLLTDTERQQLQGATGELKLRLKEKADSGKLKLGIEKLEGVLDKTGGKMYPSNSIVENVEFFLVAAIVILGLRAYFVQPFKIPTNSMWPTYYGMTHEVFKAGEEPNLLQRAGRFLAFGASRYEVVAPADGEVYMAVTPNINPVVVSVSARSFFVIPAQQLEYYFLVGNELTKMNVPIDFNFNKVLESGFGDFAPGRYAPTASQFLQEGGERKRGVVTMVQGGQKYEQTVYWLSLGKKVKKGEKIISFDILTGDLLFVDRLTYNFFPPKVGQGFVFKTDNIHSPHMEKPPGTQVKQYYIKRLVGAPGDVLEVKSPVLLSNGQPITGAASFDKNARRDGLYRGYESRGLLTPGEKLTIPAHSYFAMGDNSYESLDSRYWGFVPEKDVVGKPLFIYYPLTKRWGPAQ